MEQFEACMRLHRTLGVDGRMALASELRREPATSVQSYADMAVTLGQSQEQYDIVQRSKTVEQAREEYLRLFYTARLEPTQSDPVPATPAAAEEAKVTDSEEEDEIGPEDAIKRYAAQAYRMRGSSSDRDAVLEASTEAQARDTLAKLQAENDKEDATEQVSDGEYVRGGKPQKEYNRAPGIAMNAVSFVLMVVLCMLAALFVPFFRASEAGEKVASEAGEKVASPSDQD